MNKWTGKRILVFWNQKAFDNGSEWPSFQVLDENDVGVWCKGVKRPDGLDHDGSKTFIDFDETLDIMEWKEEK